MVNYPYPFGSSAELQCLEKIKQKMSSHGLTAAAPAGDTQKVLDGFFDKVQLLFLVGELCLKRERETQKKDQIFLPLLKFHIKPSTTGWSWPVTALLCSRAVDGVWAPVGGSV